MNEENYKKCQKLNQEKPCLSWKKADFEKNNAEIPKKLLINPSISEGESMSEDEIVDWIIDTNKTFKIIKEQDEGMFNQLYQGFILDLEYLVKIGKIDEDSIDEILNPENFQF